MSLEFLRRDIINVNEYFEKRAIDVLTTKHSFDFITEFKMIADSMEEELWWIYELQKEEHSKMSKLEIEQEQTNEKIF